VTETVRNTVIESAKSVILSVSDKFFKFIFSLQKVRLMSSESQLRRRINTLSY